MKCPACGNKGKPDSRPKPGTPPAFEFRGRLRTRVIVRCFRCSHGVFVRPFPPGYKTIPDDQWRRLDAFWQMRRAEILADLKATLFSPDGSGSGEVKESQMIFPGERQFQSSFIHAARQAGYRSAESVGDLLANRPVESALIGLTAREQTVVHDGYDEILARGGVPQTQRAAALITSAKEALAHGEPGIKAFLEDTESGSVT